MIKYLVVFVSLTFFIQGCGTDKKADPVTDSQKEIFSFFPSATQFIMYMNLTELRKTEFWNDYFKPSVTSDTSNNWLTEFEDATGTGLNNGIAEIITATTWDGNDVFAVRFDNNLDKVHEYFNSSEKFIPEKISGKPVYSLEEGAAAKYYFPKEDLLLIFKQQNYLEQVINNEHNFLKNEDEIFQVVQKIRDKEHYWIATNRGGFAAGLLGLLSGSTEMPVKNVVSSVNEISLSAHFSSGIDITSVWGCTDPEKAQLLSTTVRNAIAVELLSKKDDALTEVMKSIDISRQEKDVYIQINLDKEQLAGIRRLAEKKKLSQTL